MVLGTTKYIPVTKTPSQRYWDEVKDILHFRDLGKNLGLLQHFSMINFLVCMACFLVVFTFIVFRATFNFIVIAVQLGDVTSFNNWHRDLLMSSCIVVFALRIFCHRRLMYTSLMVLPILDFFSGFGWIIAMVLDAIQLARFLWSYGWFFNALFWPVLCVAGDLLATFFYTVSVVLGVQLVYRTQKKTIWPRSHQGKTFYAEMTI
ncbi:hypothetical protein J8273_7342 [Carpediemonas membranifera]|uniref:MARVEL domain-containing protein n=1 Tax=Carpediemonas membranifera TaxID=201153 RepID=A0A8J6AXU6_9EUKA|nr:hypothetical protein J8273_7342 [Carpediemonas membranifera]|eukprot:KAG9391068.1 hypothetical protein J8273_7342 [Carpediemonas membranifera]